MTERRPAWLNLSPASADASHVTPDPSQRAVARELSPFALATLVAFVLLPIGSAPDWSEYATAAALMAAALAGTVLAPWSGLPASARLILPVAYLAGAALLRDSGGGANTGVAILSLLPVFWIALHGTRLELAIMVFGVGLFFAVPIVLFGDPAYPAAGLRTAALYMLVGGLIGSTIQQLVLEVRKQAATGRREALTDALTGTGNRRAWDQWLALATSGRRDGPLAVCVVDLDHFKAYNDEHGHGAGDALLAPARAPGRRSCGRATSSRASAARSSPSSSPTPTPRARWRWRSGCAPRCPTARPARAGSRSGTTTSRRTRCCGAPTARSTPPSAPGAIASSRRATVASAARPDRGRLR